MPTDKEIRLDNSIERILQIRQELKLHLINECDLLPNMVEKLNENFALLMEYQGGRQGNPGRKGDPACMNLLGLNDNIGDKSGTTIIDNPKLIDVNDKGQCETPEVLLMLEKLQIVLNEYAHTPIVYSNIYMDIEDDNHLKMASVYDNAHTSPLISPIIENYKLNIYNSNEKGEGYHLHLLNSRAATQDDYYACNSGFHFSGNFIDRCSLQEIEKSMCNLMNNQHYLDMKYTPKTSELLIVGGTNTEVLNIKGLKNDKIQDHQHILNLEVDATEFQKNEKTQILRIVPNDIEMVEGQLQPFSVNFMPQRQRKDNIQRISDATGWVGIWHDNYHNREDWDIIRGDDIKILYVCEEGNQTINHNVASIININPNSMIRFKQLNRWVLIDWRIDMSIPEGQSLHLKNIRFRSSIDSVECWTDAWLPATLTVNEDECAELLQTNVSPTAKIFVRGNGFDISIRGEISFNSPLISSGQVWATMNNSECETLEIVDTLSCPVLQIVGG